MKYSIIVAYDNERGIGKNGELPWRLPGDLKRFKEITNGAVVVMGRKTWESLPGPLPNRFNVVFSTTIINDVQTVSSFDELDRLLFLRAYDRVFFIGGENIYRSAIARYNISEYHITEVFSSFQSDTFFPSVDLGGYILIDSIMSGENGLIYRYNHYEKNYMISSQEKIYLQLLCNILSRGAYHADRTGIGTLALFGDQSLTFDLMEGFPLLTTKRMYFKIVAEELFWFLSGSTNNRDLLDRGVRIWSANSTREALDKLGLKDNMEGDCGPIYSHQWRHFNAPYIDCNTTYQGYDQIAEVLRLLKYDKGSRRILFSAWNPCDLKQMCLPPCHVLYQFNVQNNNLSCVMYMRSCDSFLGLPYNIASTALLTHLLAKSANLGVDKITIYFGNVHIYMNHIIQVKEQIARTPYSFPRLNIKVMKDKLEDYNYADLEITDYKCHEAIKADMAV